MYAHTHTLNNETVCMFLTFMWTLVHKYNLIIQYCNPLNGVV